MTATIVEPNNFKAKQCNKSSSEIIKKIYYLKFK